MVFRDNRRSCPRCRRSLQEARTPLGHRFERCDECNGNWIDMTTLRRLFEGMKPGAGMPAMLSRSDGDPVVMVCPACAKPMDRKRLHRLDLDTCDGHGVWFDGKELQETLFRYALDES